MLPELARARGWPISADHCFMRVCLDTLFDGPWHAHVARPAIRHLDDAELARAIAIAASLADGTCALDPLNRRSIEARRAARVTGPPNPRR